MSIEVRTEITISLNEQEIRLSREEADALYQELRVALGKESNQPWMPMPQPLAPAVPAPPWWQPIITCSTAGVANEL